MTEAVLSWTQARWRLQVPHFVTQAPQPHLVFEVDTLKCDEGGDDSVEDAGLI